MLIRSPLPARLSTAFATKSPLLAHATAKRWPNTFCVRTQSGSASRSVSATTIRFGIASRLGLVVVGLRSAFTRRGLPFGIRGLQLAVDARCNRIALAGGLEALEQRLAVRQEREAHRRQQRRVGARLDQRLELDRRAVLLAERAGGHHVDGVERRSHDVLRVHAVAIEADDRDVLRGCLALAQRYSQPELTIAEYLRWVVLHTPGIEQRAQR